MSIITIILATIVALEHLYIFLFRKCGDYI